MAVGDESQDGTAGTASTSATGSSSATTGTSPHQTAASTTDGNTHSAAAATSAVGQQNSIAGNSGGGATSAGAGTGQATEDRSKWHPPHVNQRLSGENGRLKSEAQRLREQLAAITGITPPKQEPTRELPDGVTEQDIARARKEFALVFPELAEFGSAKELLQTLREFAEKDLPAFRDQHQHYWSQIGAVTGRQLQAEIKSQVGELSQRGLAALYSDFKTLLETNDEFYTRYAAGDPQLITDFIADYKKEVLDPYHTRQASSAAAAATTAVTRAARLPRGGNTSTVIPAGQTAAEPKTAEDRHRQSFRRMRERATAAAGTA